MPTVFSQCRIRAVSPSSRAPVMILVGLGTRDPFRGPLLHLRPRSAGVATGENQECGDEALGILKRPKQANGHHRDVRRFDVRLG
jgi:hypothetical protein